MVSGGKIEGANEMVLNTIFQQYEETLDGVTSAFCSQSGIGFEDCQRLKDVFISDDQSRRGFVADEEVSAFVEMGFNADDVRARAGEDRAKALQNRARWLSQSLSNAIKQPYSRGIDEKLWQMTIKLEELGGGPTASAEAISAVRTLVERAFPSEYHQLSASVDFLVGSKQGEKENIMLFVKMIEKDSGSQDCARRYLLVDALGRMTNSSSIKDALPTLEHLARDDNEIIADILLTGGEAIAKLRQKAADVFVKIAYTDIAELVNVVRGDRNYYIRPAALKELSKKENWGNAKQQEEVAMLLASCDFVGAVVLKGGDFVVPALFAAASTSVEAESELVKLGNQSLPYLKEALADENRQLQAAVMISKIGPDDVDVRQAAAKILLKNFKETVGKNEDEHKRGKFGNLLSALVELGKEGVSEMLKELNNDNPQIRKAVVERLLLDDVKEDLSPEDRERVWVVVLLDGKPLEFSPGDIANIAIEVLKVRTSNSALRKRAVDLLKEYLSSNAYGITEIAGVVEQLPEIKRLDSSLRRMARKIVSDRDKRNSCGCEEEVSD